MFLKVLPKVFIANQVTLLHFTALAVVGMAVDTKQRPTISTTKVQMLLGNPSVRMFENTPFTLDSTTLDSAGIQTTASEATLKSTLSVVFTPADTYLQSRQGLQGFRGLGQKDSGVEKQKVTVGTSAPTTPALRRFE